MPLRWIMSKRSSGRSSCRAAPALPWTQWSGHSTCSWPYRSISSKGFWPSCVLAKETCPAGCQSCVATRCANRLLFTSAEMGSTSSSPSSTARAPPGMKSGCMSTTSKALWSGWRSVTCPPGSVPVGEDDGIAVGDPDRVLGVRAARAVGAADRPAVGVHDDLVGALEQPRLDRDDEAGLEREPAPGAAVVGHVRVAVHRPADAVP